jgi:hypothetical protein
MIVTSNCSVAKFHSPASADTRRAPVRARAPRRTNPSVSILGGIAKQDYNGSRLFFHPAAGE